MGFRIISSWTRKVLNRTVLSACSRPVFRNTLSVPPLADKTTRCFCHIFHPSAIGRIPVSPLVHRRMSRSAVRLSAWLHISHYRSYKALRHCTAGRIHGPRLDVHCPLPATAPGSIFILRFGGLSPPDLALGVWAWRVSGHWIPLCTNGPNALIDGLTFGTVRGLKQVPMPESVRTLTEDAVAHAKQLRTTTSTANFMVVQIRERPESVIKL